MLDCLTETTRQSERLLNTEIELMRVMTYQQPPNFHISRYDLQPDSNPGLA